MRSTLYIAVLGKLNEALTYEVIPFKNIKQTNVYIPNCSDFISWNLAFFYVLTVKTTVSTQYSVQTIH